jgi:transcription initiation factor TFIIB
MSNYLVEDTVKCDECGSRNLKKDESRGEVVCEDCGLVLEDKVIDQGAEWRVFRFRLPHSSHFTVSSTR